MRLLAERLSYSMGLILEARGFVCPVVDFERLVPPNFYTLGSAGSFVPFWVRTGGAVARMR